MDPSPQIFFSVECKVAIKQKRFQGCLCSNHTSVHIHLRVWTLTTGKGLKSFLIVLL